MSDNTPLLTVAVLLEELKEITDWRMLGAYLNVPVHVLDRIDIGCNGIVEHCKIYMLQYWLDTTMTASWNDVAGALEHLNMLALAGRLKYKYLWTSLTTTADAVDTSTVSSSDQTPTATATPSSSPTDPTPFPPSLLPHTTILLLLVLFSFFLLFFLHNHHILLWFLLLIHDHLLLLVLLLLLFLLYYHAPPNTTASPPAESINSGAELTSDAKVEIKADGERVRELRDLVSEYSLMLTKCRQLLAGCDISRAQFFLNNLFKTDIFTSCDNIEQLLYQLCHRYVDTFNVYYLQKLATCLGRDDVNQLVQQYEEKKEKFLEDTTLLDFQKAIVSKTKPHLPNGMVEVAIRIPKRLTTEKTLRDMELLAMEAFGDNQKSLVRFHAYSGSIIICWFMVESLCEVLQQLARVKVAVWRQHGVEEVMVGSQCVYHYTDQDEKAAKQTEQECSALKKVYGEFYHQLVDVLSDGDTHRSIVSHLSMRSAISEKVQSAQMTETVLERGRSLLTVLSLEEKPYKLRELITVMMEVEKAKSLAEEMTAQLNKSELGHHTDQQQFEAWIDQLTSDKKDMLTQLQYYEEELKAANELLIMREKVISSMMAVDKGPKSSVKMGAEQHEAAMADLDTKLMNTEEKLQNANKLLAAQESELKEIRRRIRELEEILIVDFPSALVQVTGEGKEVAVLGQETTIQLNISSQNTLTLHFPIEQLSCQLTNPKSQHVPCYITHTPPGVCTLTFTPILLGPHQLKITIRDTDVPGSPFTIRVLSSSAMMRMLPENRGVVQGTIHGVIKPYGVAVSNSGDIVVSEYWNHRISVYSREGEHFSFGSNGFNNGQFYYPHGVAITSDNHILIADEHNHRIQKFTMEGTFVNSVGQEGKRQIQFDRPSGIAVHPSGRVFVADTRNHRIQVFNPDLSYSHMFGSQGSAPGQFSSPHGVAISSSGVVCM